MRAEETSLGERAIFAYEATLAVLQRAKDYWGGKDGDEARDALAHIDRIQGLVLRDALAMISEIADPQDG